MNLISRTVALIAVLVGTGSLAMGNPVLSIASVSNEQDGFPAAASIDNSFTTGWAVHPNEDKPNFIHYKVDNFVPGVCGIHMRFEYGTYHVPDKFTLSWSNDQGSTWHAITQYTSLLTQSGAAISVDAGGQITTGFAAATDRYTLATTLGRITDLRMDIPANSSHRGPGTFGENENYVLTMFTLTSSPVHPVHHWSFDESSGSVATDSAGGADATLSGATWTEDRFGNAGKAIQTGHNMWANPPDTVKTEIGTFAAWIYADAYGGFNQPAGPIFSAEQGSGGSNFAYRLQLHSTGIIAFEAVAPWTVGGARVALSESTIPLDTWTHVAGTYDGYTSRVYINGQLDGSSQTFETYAGMNTSPTIRVGIGHLEGWSVQWFQGRIDDARVYNVPLSKELLQEEVGVWNGYPVAANGWINSANWLGWVYVSHDPWVWIHDFQDYAYVLPSGWIYLPRIQELLQVEGDIWNSFPVSDGGWIDTADWLGLVYVSLDPWIWIHNIQDHAYILSNGWIYMPRQG